MKSVVRCGSVATTTVGACLLIAGGVVWSQNPTDDATINAWNDAITDSSYGNGSIVGTWAPATVTSEGVQTPLSAKTERLDPYTGSAAQRDVTTVGGLLVADTEYLAGSAAFHANFSMNEFGFIFALVNETASDVNRTVDYFSRAAPSTKANTGGAVSCRQTAGCDAARMQAECADMFNRDAVFVPASATNDSVLCPYLDEGCGTCSFTTYLSEACAVVSGDAYPFHGDAELHSCLYPFGRAADSYTYTMTPPATVYVTVRKSDDPFIILQRMSQGVGYLHTSPVQGEEGRRVATGLLAAGGVAAGLGLFVLVVSLIVACGSSDHTYEEELLSGGKTVQYATA